nr:uncharacterized protein LOC118968618 isoform X2 [Manis javanica]
MALPLSGRGALGGSTAPHGPPDPRPGIALRSSGPRGRVLRRTGARARPARGPVVPSPALGGCGVCAVWPGPGGDRGCFSWDACPRPGARKCRSWPRPGLGDEGAPRAGSDCAWLRDPGSEVAPRAPYLLESCRRRDGEPRARGPGTISHLAFSRHLDPQPCRPDRCPGMTLSSSILGFFCFSTVGTWKFPEQNLTPSSALASGAGKGFALCRAKENALFLVTRQQPALHHRTALLPRNKAFV